ncbi:cyclin-dependent kinase 5 activator 2 isoform X2 [Oryzias latipes]|uniref:Cyclin-dependent kinase 5 activator n=1 Tax=Oryzias latipes TaxID=8090 RepID=A0A3B3HBZ6_ORYLA|nr:cyclin-dependent kinase 5 activator 2 isoform X2 [Oryzias latipes]
MGAALSPSSQKPTRGPERQNLSNKQDGHEDADKGGKRKTHPLLLHALSWKKRLMVAKTRRRGAKKVNPVHAHGELRGHATDDDPLGAKKTGQKNGDVPLPVPKRVVMQTQKEKLLKLDHISPLKLDQFDPLSGPYLCSPLQASTGELLTCLSNFLRHRCVKLKELSSNQVILWFRKVDRALLLQGWQNQCFISPTSLVFVYLLCRDEVDEDTSSEQELHATFLTCLYLAYSYLGNEISYPLKPFLVESSRDVFWERVLELIRRLSADMLRINAEPHFFAEVFQDLKRQGGDSKTVGGRLEGKTNEEKDKKTTEEQNEQIAEDLDR